jgi:hypothetical protein
LTFGNKRSEKKNSVISESLSKGGSAFESFGNTIINTPNEIKESPTKVDVNSSTKDIINLYNNQSKTSMLLSFFSIKENSNNDSFINNKENLKDIVKHVSFAESNNAIKKTNTELGPPTIKKKSIIKRDYSIMDVKPPNLDMRSRTLLDESEALQKNKNEKLFHRIDELSKNNLDNLENNDSHENRFKSKIIFIFRCKRKGL